MALPDGGRTEFFGDIVDNIYSNFDKDAANVLNNIYDQLMEGTPRTTGTGTPVDTGTLKANWNVGIRPNSRAIERPKDGSKVTIVKKKIKRYGIHHKYYLWNNTPYISMVNAGITKAGITPNSQFNIKFIEMAIVEGLNKSNA